MFRGLLRRLAPLFGVFFSRLKLSLNTPQEILIKKKYNKTSLSFAFSTNFEFPKHLNSKILSFF